jgi:hypothetical protein
MSPIREPTSTFADRNLLVVLLLPVEVKQDRFAEGADRRETRRMDTFASSEFLKTGDDFLAGFEHDDKGALPAGLMEQFMLHDSLRWRTNGSNSAKFRRRNGTPGAAELKAAALTRASQRIACHDAAENMLVAQGTIGEVRLWGWFGS